MATLTFYQYHYGNVLQNYNAPFYETWAVITGASGNGHTDHGSISPSITSASIGFPNRWGNLQRGIVVFDTSALAGAIINSATLYVVGTAKTDTLGVAPDLNIYSAAPAVDDNFVNGDYDSLGSTAFSTAITYAGFNTGGDNTFVLNASGIANINLTGRSRFGLRNANYDVAGIAPAWSDLKSCYFSMNPATTRLVVDYTMPLQQERVPTFDDLVEFTPSSGPSNYALIDDYPSYNDSEYNYGSGAGASISDRFDFLPFTIPEGAEIYKVRLGLRCKKDMGGVPDFYARLTLNDFSSYDISISPTIDFGWVLAEWAVNPATGNPWTVNEVNGGGTYGLNNIGYMCSGTNGWLFYVSELYVQVDYTYAIEPTMTEVMRFGKWFHIGVNRKCNLEWR